ncbi:hypothetical protein V6N11_056189 [Hibiscus sabdariffa]|uniref:Uncharacterized protein n=1 Tax=Hibiscus sabdariffa TaxID=183260 RepID=A0ABR2T355_9ROSI
MQEQPCGKAGLWGQSHRAATTQTPIECYENSPHTRGGRTKAEQGQGHKPGGRPRQRPATPGRHYKHGRAKGCPETEPAAID